METLEEQQETGISSRGSATTLTHRRAPGRAASAPVISILYDSAQDGGAGSGKRRDSEYCGAAGEPGGCICCFLCMVAGLLAAHRYVDDPVDNSR